MKRTAIALFTPRRATCWRSPSSQTRLVLIRSGTVRFLITLAAVATCTKRTKIATGIAYAYMRNPVLNAAGAMDLDELSNGCMHLGLGSRTRSMNEMWYGEPSEPRSAAKMKECFALIRKIWAAHKGGWMCFEGGFYRLHIPAYSRPYSVRDRIPVYLTGVQKGMLWTTGEVADGLVGHALYSRKYLTEFIQPQLEIGAKRDGRTREDIDVTTLFITAISHNR